MPKNALVRRHPDMVERTLLEEAARCEQLSAEQRHTLADRLADMANHLLWRSHKLAETARKVRPPACRRARAARDGIIWRDAHIFKQRSRSLTVSSPVSRLPPPRSHRPRAADGCSSWPRSSTRRRDQRRARRAGVSGNATASPSISSSLNVEPCRRRVD
jgi:hypothetical protein